MDRISVGVFLIWVSGLQPPNCRGTLTVYHNDQANTNAAAGPGN